MFNLKTLLIASLGIAGFSPAFAADLSFKAPAAAVPNSWTGFYVGADAGGGSGRSSSSLADPANAAFENCGPCFRPGFAAAGGQKGSGMVGAAHLGYNWQLGSPLLVGLEGDFAFTGIQQRSGDTPLTAFTNAGAPFPAAGSFFNAQTDDRWLATIRGRVGTTFGNWLVYGTGGVAWGEFDSTARAGCNDVNCGPVQATVNYEAVRTGWVVGTGLEWQVPATALRARLEYLYYDFGGSTIASTPWSDGRGLVSCLSRIAGSCPANFTLSGSNIQTVRVGMSYAFH